MAAKVYNYQGSNQDNLREVPITDVEIKRVFLAHWEEIYQPWNQV